MEPSPPLHRLPSRCLRYHLQHQLVHEVQAPRHPQWKHHPPKSPAAHHSQQAAKQSEPDLWSLPHHHSPTLALGSQPRACISYGHLSSTSSVISEILLDLHLVCAPKSLQHPVELPMPPAHLQWPTSRPLMRAEPQPFSSLPPLPHAPASPQVCWILSQSDAES